MPASELDGFLGGDQAGRRRAAAPVWCQASDDKSPRLFWLGNSLHAGLKMIRKIDRKVPVDTQPGKRVSARFASG